MRGKGKMRKRKNVQQAVILAGGYGKRLAPFTEHDPKPMYPFNGDPFLGYLVREIKGFGIEDVVILLGYLPEKVTEYFGDGSRYGVRIKYCITPVEYETGARIKAAESFLQEDFLLMYCDNYCPIDFEKLQQDYDTNNASVQITAYVNKDHYTKNNLRLDGNDCVRCYDKKRVQENLNAVDIGYAIISKQVIEQIPDTNCNFEAEMYPKLVNSGKLFATLTEHRYYSIGSWERIELTKQFFSGIKTIFLDRDGTLNVKPPRAHYIESVEAFVWIDGAKEALRMLKEAGYRLILITNQPGIARGNLTEETLAEIHHKMQADLAKIGAGIDAIYYCPHNWEEECECRKPKPGMLFQAQRDFSLNLRECIMIGDDERDMHAAHAAGCRGILVDDSYTLRHAVDDILK